jgi:hypothetical protein
MPSAPTLETHSNSERVANTLHPNAIELILNLTVLRLCRGRWRTPGSACWIKHRYPAHKFHR